MSRTVASARSQGRRVAIIRGAGFRLFPRLKLASDDARKRPMPPALARREDRDPYLAVLRKRDALARVLSNPLPYIHRMARRLPRQLMVIGWRPPKRLPSGPKRELVDTLSEAWREAWFQLHEFRRRRRDSAAPDASAS